MEYHGKRIEITKAINMKQSIAILIMLTGLIACKDKKENSGDTVRITQINQETADPLIDSAAIRVVVLDFYNWYTKNYSRLQGYDLYSGIKKKDAPPYKINWDVVDKYQAFIRDSVPQLGDEFLKDQKLMFTKADSAFKVDVKDDVPYYFDYDWYTNSQEDPQYLLDGLTESKKWIIKVNGNDAAVEIGSPDKRDYVPGTLLLYVGMKKENGQWTIAKIGND
ncbi:MAG: hypothetical protein ABIT05_08025 [Chitinophagaceae bacterium]